MTVQRAIRYLKGLIEHRQKALKMIKEDVSTMRTDSGKDLGNAIIQVTECDISNLQQILAELQSRGTKSNSKGKKNSDF